MGKPDEGTGDAGAGGSAKKITIVFVVQGVDVSFEVEVNELLRAAVAKALELTRNTGRPVTDWEVRDARGTLLDPGRKIDDYRFADGVRLFVSLRVAAGGAAH